MQYLIITDLEGPAGADLFSQTRNGEPFVAVTMRQLTKEVNAAIAGILDADPQAIIHVVDGHGSGGINDEDMDQRALYIRSGKSSNKRDKWECYDALLYVGQHAMAGTPNGPLAHTGSSKSVTYKRINNVYVGEFGIGAAKAGYHGVPTIFISGDDKAVFEAETLIPGIYGVATKWGAGWQKAHHLTSDEACRRIREVIAEACRNIDRIKPLWFDSPYSSEIRYNKPHAAAATSHPQVRPEQVDAYTVRYRTDDMDLLPIS